MSTQKKIRIGSRELCPACTILRASQLPISMKINALTAARAVAALLVVIHHYGINLKPFSLCGNLFNNGNLSVGFFFVLSGFVLTIAHKKLNTGVFYLKRILRIGPAYFAALLLMLAVVLWSYPPDSDLPQQFISSALFVQSFIPKYTLELNSPAWSVSDEMFFYLLFPLLFLLRNRRRLILWLTIVAYIVSQCIHLYYAPKIWALTGSGLYFNPLIHLNQFLIGVTGGLYFKDHKRLFAGKYLAYAVFALIIVLIMIRPEQISYNDGLIAPLFLLLILALAARDKWLIDNKPLVFLGEISFGIYIYQKPVFKCIEKLNSTHWHISAAPLFYLSLLALLCVSVLSYYFLEKKALLLLKEKP